jgi:hypothetical protein
MAKFAVEKLPAHWLFVPSKRQVWQLLAELGIDMRLVEFYGPEYNRKAERQLTSAALLVYESS